MRGQEDEGGPSTAAASVPVPESKSEAAPPIMTMAEFVAQGTAAPAIAHAVGGAMPVPTAATKVDEEGEDDMPGLEELEPLLPDDAR